MNSRIRLACFVILCTYIQAHSLAQSLIPTVEVRNSYEGTDLTWKTARFAGQRLSGSGQASIQFGLITPISYDPYSAETYPLVIYLHGASARGSQVSSVLQRQTARYFAGHAQTTLAYRAIVVAPQVPSGDRFVNVEWNHGPYEQSPATHSQSMFLTGQLLDFLVNVDNTEALTQVLDIDPKTIDTRRIYVVGDSMGAYGTWDIVARKPGFFAAAIASAGSGPKNRLSELNQTPFWAIHGQTDSTVPNSLPTTNEPDGQGSLGMLSLIDPNFNNTGSTVVVKKDSFSSAPDNPTNSDIWIYSEIPGLGHGTVAIEWTTRVSGVLPWLFGFNAPVRKSQDVTGDNIVNPMDLKVLSNNWLLTQDPPDYPFHEADLNTSGGIDTVDLAIMGTQWDQDLSQMPLARWSFDEGTGDSIAARGGKPHGLLLKMDENIWAEGISGTCLQPDGIDDSALIPNPLKNDFTISFWARTDLSGREVQIGRTQIIHGLVDGTLTERANDFGIQMHGAKLALVVGRTSGKPSTITSDTDINDNQWHHLCATRRAVDGEMKVYIDGIEEDSLLGTKGKKDASEALRIGALHSSSKDGFFRGSLDELLLYDRVLDAVEIRDLMQ